MLLGIDPGTRETAMVATDCREIVVAEYVPNAEVFKRLDAATEAHWTRRPHVVVEGIQAMGMIVGQETFDTAVLVGRIVQHCIHRKLTYSIVYRGDVKRTMCGTSLAKDANIRQAVIDAFGSDSVVFGVRCEACRSSKARRAKCPTCAGTGFTQQPHAASRVTGHCWQALAVAVAFNRMTNGGHCVSQ